LLRPLYLVEFDPSSGSHFNLAASRFSAATREIVTDPSGVAIPYWEIFRDFFAKPFPFFL
jgi:hypothetical protein